MVTLILLVSRFFGIKLSKLLIDQPRDEQREEIIMYQISEIHEAVLPLIVQLVSLAWVLLPPHMPAASG
jgi:hypothetical protein